MLRPSRFILIAAAFWRLPPPRPSGLWPAPIRLPRRPPSSTPPRRKPPFSVTDKDFPSATISGYNNFYEFGTGKDEPARNAPKWNVPAPWTVRIEGPGADKPQTLDLDAIMKLAPLEERIYRHRCVEAWSIVVPWIGFSLSALLKRGGSQQQGQVCRVSELLRSESDALPA